MAHELGHCLSPSLEGDDAEDFADAFAASLLYPHELAEQAYEVLVKKPSTAAKINTLKQMAELQVISQILSFSKLTSTQSGLIELKL